MPTFVFMKAYLLTASEGSYDDFDKWTIGVYDSYDLARQVAESLSIEVKKTDEYRMRGFSGFAIEEFEVNQIPTEYREPGYEKVTMLVKLIYP